MNTQKFFLFQWRIYQKQFDDVCIRLHCNCVAVDQKLLFGGLLTNQRKDQRVVPHKPLVNKAHWLSGDFECVIRGKRGLICDVDEKHRRIHFLIILYRAFEVLQFYQDPATGSSHIYNFKLDLVVRGISNYQTILTFLNWYSQYEYYWERKTIFEKT